MTSKTSIPGLFDFGVKREVVKRTPLRAYPGWKIVLYRDEFGRETFAAESGSAVSPLEASWGDALHFAKHDAPKSVPEPDSATIERGYDPYGRAQ